MTLALLINGVAHADIAHAVSAGDRGLAYGDGVFETILIQDGRARFLDDHLGRMHHGCERLGFAPPDRHLLEREIAQVVRGLRSAVLKVIVTRGASGRGYRPPNEPTPTRILAVYVAPAPYRANAVVRWCATRLARNARLAGVKHLNRLEQVLAQAEWTDPQIDEGLMLDTEGELICGTASNVFLVRDDVLTTPDLRFSGVRGVMRGRVLQAAATLGISVLESPLWPHDLEQASEVFLTSALRGVQSVNALEELHWSQTRTAERLREALSV